MKEGKPADSDVRGLFVVRMPARGRGRAFSVPKTSASRSHAASLQMSLIRSATIVVSTRSGTVVPTTLTLKNIPDEVYVRLKASAQSQRGSLNSEAIFCLEAVLIPGRATEEEAIDRACAIREALPKSLFTAKDIDAFRHEGRP